VTETGLLIPTRAGSAVARRHHVLCEAPTNWDDPSVAPCADLLRSGHAPFAREGRLNVGAVHGDYQAFSLRVIGDYIERAKEFPSVRTIVVHPCPRLWNETAGVKHLLREVGDYGLFIVALQGLAERASDLCLDLVLEYNRAYWDTFADNESYDPERHTNRVREYFATSPEEWAQVPADVGASNFGLCLDTSHAATYAHRFPEPERLGVVERYLDLGGDRIWHLHWNGNTLKGFEGRADRHLPLGRDGLPAALHRRIRSLPGTRSWLLERWVDEETLAAELEFIRALEAPRTVTP